MVDLIDLFNWIIENKDIIKIFYGLIITVICAFIVIKVDKLFKLSMHQGIRYFRNAFFFYGLAFIFRYFLGTYSFYEGSLLNPSAIKFIFEFFLIMAGFFLLYSLVWKRIENSQEKNPSSSLFNKNLLVFYFMAFVIVFLDYLWSTYFFMFLSQIILFVCLSIISYINYSKGKKQHRFLKLYFVAMILSLIAWILNAILALSLNWNKGVLVNIYILNIIFFLLVLYGVVKVTRKI